MADVNDGLKEEEEEDGEEEEGKTKKKRRVSYKAWEYLQTCRQYNQISHKLVVTVFVSGCFLYIKAFPALLASPFEKAFFCLSLSPFLAHLCDEDARHLQNM